MTTIPQPLAYLLLVLMAGLFVAALLLLLRARGWSLENCRKEHKTMQIYNASKLENAPQVRAVRDALMKAGHSITYDWTQHGSVVGQGTERLKETAKNEAYGVASADMVVVLLPGGRGTHAELGMCIARNIPVLLVSENPDHFRDRMDTCAFYWNSNITQFAYIGNSLPDKIVELVENFTDER